MHDLQPIDHYRSSLIDSKRVGVARRKKFKIGFFNEQIAG